MSATPDPVQVARDQRRLAEAWAENAVIDIRSITSVDEIPEWILEQKDGLERANRHAPEAFTKVKVALALRDKDLRNA